MTTAIDILGGRKALGVKNDLELESLLRLGLPISALAAIAKNTEFTPAVIETIVSRRTQGRAGRSLRLTPETSSRLARFARVWATAVETFRDRGTARAWFFTSVPGLGGATPFHMLETENGALLAERELVRLSHGVYS